MINFFAIQLKTIIIFPKRSILDLWSGSEYVSQYVLIDLQSGLVLCIVWYILRILHIVVNSDIFRIQYVFRTLSKNILEYSERCSTHAYWETCDIQNFAIFRILAYLGPEAYRGSCLCRHIQAYSGIFNNDGCNNINFLFLTLILHTFQWNVKRHVFWLQWRHFNARRSLLVRDLWK